MSDIIDLAPHLKTNEGTVEKLTDPPIIIRGRFIRHCSHQYVVDEERHSIECSKCGEVVDPFQAMLDIARKWRAIHLAAKDLYRQHDKLVEEVSELERKKRNLQASIRRLSKKE